MRRTGLQVIEDCVAYALRIAAQVRIPDFSPGEKEQLSFGSRFANDHTANPAARCATHLTKTLFATSVALA